MFGNLDKRFLEIIRRNEKQVADCWATALTISEDAFFIGCVVMLFCVTLIVVLSYKFAKF
jgi:hypothetical protein